MNSTKTSLKVETFLFFYPLSFFSAPSSPRSPRCQTRRAAHLRRSCRWTGTNTCFFTTSQLSLRCHRMRLELGASVDQISAFCRRTASRTLMPHSETPRAKALIHWEYEMWELWLFNIIPPAWRSWWSRLSRTFRVIFYNCPLCIRNHRLPEKLCSVCGTSVSLFHSCFTFN